MKSLLVGSQATYGIRASNKAKGGGVAAFICVHLRLFFFDQALHA